MDDGFKKWLCDKAGHQKCFDKMWKSLQFETLIKAMWAINRAYEHERGKWWIDMGSADITLDNTDWLCASIFFYKNHNNSETEALTACLKHMYNQEDQSRQ